MLEIIITVFTIVLMMGVYCEVDNIAKTNNLYKRY